MLAKRFVVRLALVLPLVTCASSCATLKELATACLAPGVAGASGDAIDGLLADLDSGQAPSPDEWKARAVNMAMKYGAPLVICAASHLWEDLRGGLVAGPVQPRRCKHRVHREHEQFLRYLSAGGWQ